MSTDDARTPGEKLATAVADLQKNPWLKLSGHAGTLGVVVDYLGDLQRRLAGAESALEEEKRRRVLLDTRIGRLEGAAALALTSRAPAMIATRERNFARLEEQALQVMAIAKAEGMLTPIADAERPGGVRPGDKPV